MPKKQLQYNPNEDRSSSSGDDGSFLDPSHNLEVVIKHIRTKDVLSANEDMYRSFFKENNAVILLVNPENSDIVDANTAACKYYGWTLEEITSKKINQVNALSTEEIKAETQRATDEKRNYFFLKHRLANGEIRDVEVYSGPMVLNSQSLLYYIVHDITERKLAEEELRRKEMQLRTAQKVGHVGSWEFDLNSGKVDVSEEARRIYGLEGEQLTIEIITKSTTARNTAQCWTKH